MSALDERVDKILAIVRAEPGVTFPELCRRLGCAKSTLSPTISYMVGQEMVEFHHVTGSRRPGQVYPIPERLSIRKLLTSKWLSHYPKSRRRR